MEMEYLHEDSNTSNQPSSGAPFYSRSRGPKDMLSYAMKQPICGQKCTNFKHAPTDKCCEGLWQIREVTPNHRNF